MKRKIITMFIFFLITVSIYSFQFQPITMDFHSQGRDATQNFQCYNDSPERIALMVRILERTITPLGEEILNPAEEDFQLYPRRIVLEPQQTQNIRVHYRGPIVEQREKSYRIIVEQVPVNFNDESTQGLRILYRYIGSIYVIPERLYDQITITEINTIGENLVEIHMENWGTSHVILEDFELELIGQDQRLLTPENFPELMGINFLAGSKRIFRVEVPNSNGNEEWEGHLHYDGIR